MTIFEKAKELGEMLGQSKEIIQLRQAEENLLGNPDALEVLNAFNSMRQEYIQKGLASGNVELIQEYKKKVLERNEALSQNVITKEYLDKKERMDALFKAVTSILQKSVNGMEEEDNDQASSGCGSGGCGGCSGCG